MTSEIVRRIPIDHLCVDLFPQRVLRVTELQFEIMLTEESDDEIGVLRIEYMITPSLPRFDLANEPPFFSWHWFAVDDMGTHYTDVGGAYGPSKDYQSTSGDLSLQPLPPPDSSILTITLSPYFWAEERSHLCSFTVDLRA